MITCGQAKKVEVLTPAADDGRSVAGGGGGSVCWW